MGFPTANVRVLGKAKGKQVTKVQARQQITDAIACKTAMLSAQGWRAVEHGSNVWKRDEATDHLVGTFEREAVIGNTSSTFSIRIEDVTRLADEWNRRGNRQQRRKRGAIARAR